ncbi:hypothetical protein TELCIR_17258 [Teladorsagia circumcincta]|uniref:Uncharacterized protein n=1 Tax=Teladorsagia circumcincta TaxID=45464 RepID=A0A2G9TTH1_TELCI|nr:hypothetical protein TELCIR_17258 [Teladorsagia circumcincta]
MSVIKQRHHITSLAVIVPLVTSTDSTSSPTGFSHGGPRSAHSVHSAPQSNSNCNPPSTPTPSAPLSTPFPTQVPTSQPSSFPQSSPQSSTFRPPSSPQSARYPSTTPNQSSSFPQNTQSQTPFFQQPPSSQGENFPPSSMASSANFSMASSSQNVGFPPSAPQPSNYPQQNAMQQGAYAQQMPSGVGYPTSCPQPSTSNPYACGPSGGMMSNATDPAFMGQQGMVNPGFGMNGYPGYDMPSSAHMSQQQQMAIQAHHQQQMMMGVAGAGGTMSAQQYHMVMMQKHQQHMKAVMQQRAAMIYQGYPNGANMSQQQYFMHMQKMQQARFASGVDPSASAFMSAQRMMGMRGAPMSAAGPMMEPMPPTGGYPSGYSQGMQSFPPQQQYVGQFSMN